MIVKPQPRSPVIIAVSLLCPLKYLRAGTALELEDRRNPYLALEIHGSRAYQIAFIVRLLQG
jgi:hypothetical protein